MGLEKKMVTLIGPRLKLVPVAECKNCGKRSPINSEKFYCMSTCTCGKCSVYTMCFGDHRERLDALDGQHGYFLKGGYNDSQVIYVTRKEAQRVKEEHEFREYDGDIKNIDDVIYDYFHGSYCTCSYCCGNGDD